jgi:hypothetical protein
MGNHRVFGGRRRLSLGLCVLVLLGTCPATGWGAEARITAMGGGVKQITVADEHGIWSLPSTLLDFGSWAALHSAGRMDEPTLRDGRLGVHISLTDAMALGVYAGTHRRPNLSIGGRFDPTGFGYAPFGEPSVVSEEGETTAVAKAKPGYTHQMAILFATALSDTVRLGARFGVWLDGDDSGALVDDPLVIDAGLGCSAELFGGDVSMGVGVKSGVGRTVGDVRLSRELAVDATLRGQWKTKKGHQAIPYVHTVYTTPMGDEHPDGTARAAVLMVSAGSDLRLSLGDHVTVQPGLGITYAREVVRWQSDGNDVHTDVVAPYYNIAVDVGVTDWLRVRFGGSQEFQVIKVDHGEGVVTSTSDVVHRVTAGLGWTFPGGLVLDMQLATGWGRRGPLIVTGDRSTSVDGSATLSMGW